MECDVSLFRQRIEEIKAALEKLDDGAASLERGLALLCRHIPADLHAEREYLDAVRTAILGMRLSHSSLLQAAANLSSTSGEVAPPPARTPLEALRDAATALVIIRNAMDMLANDDVGIANLTPWQRELFTKSYGGIAGVAETLREAQRELREGGPSKGPDA